MAKGIPEVSDYLVYGIGECILYVGDREQVIESGEIHSFALGCDYTGSEVFPEFLISLMVDRKTFFDIMGNKDSLKMLLKITYHVNTPQEGEVDDKGRDRVWFNEKFVVYMDDKHYDLQQNQNAEMDKEFRNIGDDEKDISQHKEYNVDLFIFKESDVNTAYTVHNDVITSSNIPTLVTYLLNKSDAKNVLMSPMLDTKVKQAILLPITTVANMKYLASQYGIHSHGTLIFFDLDLTYVLNKKIGCTAWRKGEYTDIVFVIRKDDDEKSFMGGTRQNVDDHTVYVNLPATSVSFKSFTSMDSLIQGGIIHSIDSVASKTTKTTSKGKARKLHDKFIHNKYRNNNQHNVIQQELNDRGMVATLSIQDGNIHWYRPNKNFVFTFELAQLEKNLGGKYKILNLYMKFTNYGEHFRNETTMMFSKGL